jgi:hypothetical protein
MWALILEVVRIFIVVTAPIIDLTVVLAISVQLGEAVVRTGKQLFSAAVIGMTADRIIALLLHRQ